MSEDGKILRERLDGFQIEQISKFFAVREKHKDSDVCDNRTDWGKFTLWEVWDHLLEEIYEASYLLHGYRQKPKKIKATNLKQLRKECVDIANMAFILGEIAKELQIQKLAATLPDNFDPDQLKR